MTDVKETIKYGFYHFRMFSLPKRVQSDRDTEFQGDVKVFF